MLLNIIGNADILSAVAFLFERTHKQYRHFLFLGITKINGKINALFHIRHPPTIVPQVIPIIHAVKVIVHMFDDNGKK